MAVHSLPTVNIPCVQKWILPEMIHDVFAKNHFPIVHLEGGPVNGKTYDSYFVSFKPIDPNTMNPMVNSMFEALLSGRPTKMWYNDTSFWHINLSDHAHHLKTMDPVGPEYEYWDGTGSYDAFLQSYEDIIFGDF